MFEILMPGMDLFGSLVLVFSPLTPVSLLCTWNFGKRMEISVICRTKEDHHSDKDKH